MREGGDGGVGSREGSSREWRSVMGGQGSGWQAPSEAGKARERLSPQASEGHSHANTLIFDPGRPVPDF